MPLPKTHKEHIKDKKNMFQIDGVNDIHRMFCRYNRNQCRINFSENQRKILEIINKKNDLVLENYYMELLDPIILTDLSLLFIGVVIRFT